MSDNYPTGMMPAQSIRMQVTCEHCAHTWEVIGIIDLGNVITHEGYDECPECGEENIN